MRIRRLTIALLWSYPLAAQGISVPGLYNTGVDASGNVLPLGSAEIHYSQSGLLQPGATVATPFSLWTDAPPGSAWIRPVGSDDCDPVGLYVYTLDFDLTGIAPGSVVVTGEMGTDNATNLFLNGADTGIVVNDCCDGSLTPFTVSSGFVAGINTLEFRVNNNPGGCPGNPTGLLVANLAAHAPGVPALPEAAVVVLGTGLAGVGLFLLRGRRRTAS